MTPTIIIGLGSTGKAVLLKIRKMIVEKYGALDQLPIISFLLIDTDANNLKSQPQRERINNQNISLRDEEKVHASINEADAKEILDSLLRDVSGVSKKPSEDQSFEDWLKKIIGTIESPEPNFDEVFEIGELCEYAFSHNYVAIKEKFLKALEEVRSGRQHMNDIGDKIEDGVNVIIACSLWEGVGSGMFLNLAYHLRDWLRDEFPEEKTTILGGLIESRNLKNSRQKYNNADALKKLNSHRSFIPLYPTVVKISDIVAKGEPFDRCFEVDANIVNFQIPDLNAVMEIAKDIFSTIDNDYSTWNGIFAVLILAKNLFTTTKGRKIIGVFGVFLTIISFLAIVLKQCNISSEQGISCPKIIETPVKKDVKAIYLEDVIQKADKIDTSLPNQEKMMMDGSVSMVTLMSNLRKKSFNEQEYIKKSQYGDMNFIQNETPPEKEKPNGSTKAIKNMLTSARENKLMNNDVLSIVASSSPLKESDKEYLQEFPIAYDSISVVVNKDNPVKSLSLKQLRSIYQGETKFWEEINGGEPKTRINIYQRSKDSGTREVFKKIILRENEDFVKLGENEDFVKLGVGGFVYYEEEKSDQDSPSLRKVENKDGKSTNNGIYYLTYSDAKNQKDKKIIEILKIDGIDPEPQTILDGKYKLSRMVYLVIPNKSRVTVQEFIKNVLSKEGQEIVKESGFIPLISKFKN